MQDFEATPSPERAIYHIELPGLVHLHSGKVRESYRIDERHRLLIVTDRISCFDMILRSPIPDKGAVLNSVAEHWFARTTDICSNHFVRSIDPVASIVREALPVKVEVVVRGYLAGSLWRAYERGRRELCGRRLPDGLRQNQAFDSPIITPTTKESVDREISPEEMVAAGLATKGQWERMSELALGLYERGTTDLAPRGLLLVDTKYEFGVIDGEISLIDEIHTPDSSRFWHADAYAADPWSVEPLDKELVRRWLRENPLAGGELRDELPENVVRATRERYLRIHRLITGKDLDTGSSVHPAKRLERNLRAGGLPIDGDVLVFEGPEDVSRRRPSLPSFPKT